MTAPALVIFALFVPFLTTLFQAARLPGLGVISGSAALVPYALLVLNASALRRREHLRATVPLLLFTGWGGVLLLGVVHGYADEVVEQAAKVIGWGLFFFLSYLAEYRAGAGRTLLLALGLSALPIVARILLGVFTGQYEYNEWQGQLQYGEVSANKDIVHVVMSAYCLALLLQSSSGWRRTVVLCALLACCGAVVVANVRIAQLGIAVVLLYLAWRSGPGVRLTIGLALGLLLGVASVRDRVLVRWTAITDGTHTGTVVDRLLWWQAGISETLAQSPVLGVGKSFRLGLGDQVFPFHSIFVQTFVESGALGVTLLLAIASTVFVVLLRHGWRLRKDDTSSIALIPAVFALFASYFGMSISENTFLSGHQNWVFWGTAGVLLGMAARACADGSPTNAAFATFRRPLAPTDASPGAHQ